MARKWSLDLAYANLPYVLPVSLYIGSRNTRRSHTRAIPSWVPARTCSLLKATDVITSRPSAGVFKVFWVTASRSWRRNDLPSKANRLNRLQDEDRHHPVIGVQLVRPPPGVGPCQGVWDVLYKTPSVVEPHNGAFHDRAFHDRAFHDRQVHRQGCIGRRTTSKDCET